ncbi:hypothetical protein D3C81_1657410 [compost metagenome]
MFDRQRAYRKNIWIRIVAFQYFLRLAFHFINCPGTRSRYGLIGRNNNPGNPIAVIQRLESCYHLNGRAVRVGDNALMLIDLGFVDFRNHQRRIRIHTERICIINAHGSMTYGVRSKLLTYISTCTEQSDINTFKTVRASFFNGNFLSLKSNAGSCRTGRR